MGSEFSEIIGQDEAVAAIKRAALSHRNVLLIGLPGTGKSMLAGTMTKLLKPQDNYDVLAKANEKDANHPIIELHPAGSGREIIAKETEEAEKLLHKFHYNTALGVVAVLALVMSYVLLYGSVNFADMLFSLLISLTWLMYRRQNRPDINKLVSNLIIDRESSEVPFIDASGSSKNILLGDIKHDPYQSGGLETPPHHLLTPGLIHRANGGILYIDEIGTLDAETQFFLLTAMQEKKLPIEGRSENSSGSTVKTDPIPCDFTLVAAGNIETIGLLHPALRSRIQGYGMEILMKSHMKINEETPKVIRQFIEQEMVRENVSLEFSDDAIQTFIFIAEAIGRRDGYISLQFRELGGLVRWIADFATETVTPGLVINAYRYQLPIETQQDIQAFQRMRNHNNKAWALVGCDILPPRVSMTKSTYNILSQLLGDFPLEVGEYTHVSVLVPILLTSKGKRFSDEVGFIGMISDDLTPLDTDQSVYLILKAYIHGIQKIILFSNNVPDIKLEGLTLKVFCSFEEIKKYILSESC